MAKISLENDSYYRNYGVYAIYLLVETCNIQYLIELSEMEIIWFYVGEYLGNVVHFLKKKWRGVKFQIITDIEIQGN